MTRPVRLARMRKVLKKRRMRPKTPERSIDLASRDRDARCESNGLYFTAAKSKSGI